MTTMTGRGSIMRVCCGRGAGLRGIYGEIFDLKHHKKVLKIYHLNVFSLKINFNDVLILLNSRGLLNLDVIILSETLGMD